jgi:hypothetical protein
MLPLPPTSRRPTVARTPAWIVSPVAGRGRARARRMARCSGGATAGSLETAVSTRWPSNALVARSWPPRGGCRPGGAQALDRSAQLGLLTRSLLPRKQARARRRRARPRLVPARIRSRRRTPASHEKRAAALDRQSRSAFRPTRRTRQAPRSPSATERVSSLCVGECRAQKSAFYSERRTAGDGWSVRCGSVANPPLTAPFRSWECRSRKVGLQESRLDVGACAPVGDAHAAPPGPTSIEEVVCRQLGLQERGGGAGHLLPECEQAPLRPRCSPVGAER